ncbi:phosphoglycerol transferase MdoB-like AlkP superfamily enzyme [Acinetobacter calcoaceticus]|uniref:Phosphoglycerol transferase MdoB-like AlkP superfamily enzyme n=1 Tax=Acinetobacter calcoaceticus TaxID=471 RepID=A0A4R1XMV3_ACICA|nr:phosphoglycerol transferase MdoB-like AlkP superfamily enzyme [Acinetobacter calcoaceticus]
MSLLKQQLVFLLVAILSVLVFFLYQEDLNRFMAMHPVTRTARLFKYGFSILLNYALISGVYLLLRKTWLTIVLSQFVVLLLTFINIQKEQYLAASLVPSDFLLISETLTASPFILKVLVFAGCTIFLALFYWLYKKEAREPQRLLWINATLSISIIGFFVTANFKNNFFEYCSTTVNSQLCQYTGYLPNTRGDWVGDHLTIKSLGFSTFFFSKSVDNLNNKIFQAKNVSQLQIQALFPVETLAEPVVAAQQTAAQASVVHSAPLETEATAPVQPNIIFIMSESHWDATQLDRSIPKNITPTINQQQVSTLLSPSFGGGTANVEFEVLTSLNVYLNQNELLYVSKLKRPTYSLARYFNQLGYASTAMHNNGKYFYNRSAVYQNLGFQRFISLENMVNAADRKNYINQAGWANDDLLYDSIHQQLQNTDQPQFIYAISVENHPMYNDDRFGKDGYPITKAGVSDSTKRQLNTYLMGMNRADQKLKQLIETVKKLDRPTLIVFFGDHLPNLQKVYDDYGYFASEQDKTQKVQLKRFETPLSVWSNFPIDRKQLTQDYIPAHFLASEIITAANLPRSPYYGFIDQVSNCYKGIHQTGVSKSESCPQDATQLYNAYADLNMDVLNGKNWTYQLLKTAQDH